MRYGKDQGMAIFSLAFWGCKNVSPLSHGIFRSAEECSLQVSPLIHRDTDIRTFFLHSTFSFPPFEVIWRNACKEFFKSSRLKTLDSRGGNIFPWVEKNGEVIASSASQNSFKPILYSRRVFVPGHSTNTANRRPHS